MALSKEANQQLVADYGRDGNDTGSPEVQIAMLTKRIRELTEHLKVHKHDFHSERGLMKLVGRRKRLMRYLQREDVEAYRDLIQKLEIRG